MTTMKKLAAGAATTVLAMAVLSGAAFAQETTGGINGTARTSAGGPLANAPVTVVYGPTNQTFTTTTDSRGLFNIRQLPPGGPYTVKVGDLSQTVDTVELGAPTQVDIGGSAGAAGNAVSEVTVTASRAAPQTVLTGPRSTFNATDVETLPTFSRDLRDIARLNPFVQIDPTNNQALIIAGTNNRFNAIYIDGVRESDDFGLNANGYPTQRSPISIDLVQSLNVEVAPYDTQYGAFQGGVLNVVTKSGSNEFHGSASYEYDSDHFGAGKQIRDTYRNLAFQDKSYSFTLGGPIIKDKLFFEFGYEKYEGLTASSYGPGDASGVTNAVSGTTQAQVAQVQQILKSRYGYDAGVFGVTQPIQSEKYFGKLTWQITDKQRFVFEAQSTADSNFNQPDSSATRLGLSSTNYAFEQPLQSFSGYLYSNWTPNLSTELSYTHRQTDGLTDNLGQAGPHFNIYLNGVASGTDIEAGPDISRQANILNTTEQLLRAKANYSLGAHTFTVGYERDELSVFNLFVQNATGAYTFTSLANLAAGNASQLTYANAASNNPNDGSATWGDVIHTGYVQDEWRILSNLTLRGGVRVEYYEQGDKPKANPLFQSLYGFSNTQTLDGDVVVMPRLGFNYRPFHNLVLNGGVGLFSGGNPNVWISNNYSNTGNLLGSVTCTPTTLNCSSVLNNISGLGVPASVQALNTASANTGTGITNALSPNFDPPSVWKASIGAAYTLNFSELPWTGVVGHYLGDGWRLHGDYLYQTVKDAVLWQDLQTLNSVIGTAPDGRPIYNPNRAGGVGRPNTYDIVLTDTHKGHGEIWALGGGKTFENGIDFDVTYTHTDTKDVNPGTSSVALSNYRQVAFSDPNNPGLATSNYSIPDSVKLNFGITHNFFGDYATRLRIYAQRRSGLPYSFTFAGTNSAQGTNDVYGLANAVGGTGNSELFYVPRADASGNVTLTSDPKVSYATGFDINSFNAYLKASGLSKYTGTISPRNAFNSRSVSQIDLQFTQEIPAFFPTKAKAELYFQIFNLGNMINNSWGVVDQIGFPYFSQVVSNAIVSCAGRATCAPGQANQYVYSPVSGRTTGFGQTPTINTGSSGQPPTSTWALKVGVRYKF